MKFQNLLCVTKVLNKTYGWQAMFSSPYKNFSSKAVEVSYTHYSPNAPSISPPVFVLHAFLGSKQNCRGLGNAIAKMCQKEVYIVDARNHGDSPHSDEFSYDLMYEDVKQLMVKLSISKSVLIGHCMGGRTAMNVALKDKNLVDKLIVIDVSPIKMPESCSVFMSAYMSAMKEAIPIMEGLGIVEARKAVNEHLSKSIPEESIRQFLLTNLGEKNNKVVWKANIDVPEKVYLTEICDFSFSGCFMGETLFICGGRSPYVKTQDYPEIRRLFPKAEFTVIEEAGHWVDSDQPHKFLEAVSNFL